MIPQRSPYIARHRAHARGVTFVEAMVAVATSVVVGGAIVAALSGALDAGSVRQARCIVGLAAAGACEAGKSTLSAEVAAATITPVPPSEGVVCNAMGCKESGNCFVPGTPVLTPRGLVPIEAIAVGDEVLSRDGAETGVDTAHLVVATKRTASRPVVDVALRSFDGLTTDHVRATLEHPFFVRARGFVGAGDLELGDVVDGIGGGRVEALTFVARASDVYNLEVADVHTYRVGRLGALVHNQCIPRTQSAPVFAPRQTWTQAPRPAFQNPSFAPRPVQQSQPFAPSAQPFSPPLRQGTFTPAPQVFSGAPTPQPFPAVQQPTFAAPAKTGFVRQDREYAVYRVSEGKNTYTLVQQQNQNGCGPSTLASFLNDATRGRLVVEDKPANAGALSWELRGTIGTAIDGPTPSLQLMIDTANRVGVRTQQAKSFADALGHANQPGGAIVGMYNVDEAGKPLVNEIGHIVRVVKTDGNKVLVVDPMETKPVWLDKRDMEKRYMGLGMYAK